MEQMLEQARNTLQMEADAILELVPRVDEHFSAAVAMILDCPGRVVITLSLIHISEPTRP